MNDIETRGLGAGSYPEAPELPEEGARCERCGWHRGAEGSGRAAAVPGMPDGVLPGGLPGPVLELYQPEQGGAAAVCAGILVSEPVAGGAGTDRHGGILP